MPAAESHLLALSDEQRQVLESWLMAFDHQWDEQRLVAHLAKLPPPGDPLRRPALIEMVKIDLERHWQRGQPVRLESYLKSLPELGTRDTVPADLIQAEWDVRRQFGATAELADFQNRFPRQAEQLRQLLQGSVRPGPGSKAAMRPPDTARPVSSVRNVAAVGAGDDLPEQFGRYRILKQLGKGGMGSVYLAHDSQLDRRVALKVPHFAPEDGPEVLERFRREARAAATIEHPNICPVYDVGEVNGVNYLTMAYVEGRPLSDLLKGDKPLPQRSVAAVVRKLALALEEAHKKGVIHRDLKPSNVMINRRKEPVLMDFGLARRVDKGEARLTKSGSVLGTPAYMPPEQVSGNVQAMGPPCDVYSLGVILYELLTGRLPFEGPVMAVLAQILTQEPEPPSVHRPDLDPRLRTICLKAMAKQPQDRYRTMSELAAALGSYLARQQPVSKNKSNDSRLDLSAVDHSSLLAPGTSSEGQNQNPSRVLPAWLWIGAAGAAAAALLSIVIIIRIKNKTIQIETNDNDAVVEVHHKADPPERAGARPESKPAAAPSPEKEKQAPPPSSPTATASSREEKSQASPTKQAGTESPAPAVPSDVESTARPQGDRKTGVPRPSTEQPEKLVAIITDTSGVETKIDAEQGFGLRFRDPKKPGGVGAYSTDLIVEMKDCYYQLPTMDIRSMVAENERDRFRVTYHWLNEEKTIVGKCSGFILGDSEFGSFELGVEKVKKIIVTGPETRRGGSSYKWWWGDKAKHYNDANKNRTFVSVLLWDGRSLQVAKLEGHYYGGSGIGWENGKPEYPAKRGESTVTVFFDTLRKIEFQRQGEITLTLKSGTVLEADKDSHRYLLYRGVDTNGVVYIPRALIRTITTQP
jgi:serine/threonine protein kinase